MLLWFQDSLTSLSLFFQVCNCNKYLKVSRERMKQLVESSRQELGDGSGRGELASTAGPCLGREELPHWS